MTVFVFLFVLNLLIIIVYNCTIAMNNETVIARPSTGNVKSLETQIAFLSIVVGCSIAFILFAYRNLKPRSETPPPAQQESPAVPSMI